MESDLRTDFKNPGKSGHLNCLFPETSIIKMLEASDYKAVDKIPLFLGALVEECCGTNGTANHTRVFTMYVDMVDSTYRSYMDPGWS